MMMDDRLIIVAMDKEVCLVRELGLAGPVLIGGIGQEMVRSLRLLPRDTPILNVGYCGSNRYAIGTRHEVSHSQMLAGGQVYRLGPEPSESILCLTAPDFVTESTLSYPALYDMELALILKDGFCDVRSIKVVSDQLDMNQYEQFIQRGK